MCLFRLPTFGLKGPCVLEYSLPDLSLLRRLSGRQLAGDGSAEEPEGLVCAHGSLYVAWLDSMAVSATPLEALPPAEGCSAGAPQPATAAGAAGRANEPAAGTRQRTLRRPPGQAQWVMWGMRRGPDGALYVSCNAPYASEAQGYSNLPPELGRGFVARLAINDRSEPAPCPPRGCALVMPFSQGQGTVRCATLQWRRRKRGRAALPWAAHIGGHMSRHHAILLPTGELRGHMRRFTKGSLLSRPSGLCFDDAGDLYVTHMGGQVGARQRLR